MSKSNGSSSDLILPRKAGEISPPEGLGLWAKWEIELKDGERIIERRAGPSHSFTKNFGKLIRGMFDYSSEINEVLTERGGVTYSVKVRSNATATSTGPLNTAASRIRFGNSSTALNSNQVDLQGTILSATFGAVTTTLTGSGESSTGTIFQSEGQVTNATGGSFTVEEMGLYSLLANESQVAQDTMLLRDLTGSVVVANTLTILGRWTFTLLV